MIIEVRTLDGEVLRTIPPSARARRHVAAGSSSAMADLALSGLASGVDTVGDRRAS